jgi:hypothetical protein
MTRTLQPHRAKTGTRRALVARRCASLCVLAGLVTGSPARAQVLAMASPNQAVLTVKPGEPILRDVTVSNLGAEPVKVRVRLSDWTLSERGEIGLAPLGSTAGTLEGVLYFSPSELLIAPGGMGRIHVIANLGDSGRATRWGMLLSEVRPAVAGRSVESSMGTELGTTLLVSRIAPDQVQAEITGLTASALGGDSVVITARLRNTGLRHLFTTGEAALADSKGVRLGGGPIPMGLVLPGATRYFEWVGTTARAPGACLATATLDCGALELIVGETSFTWPAAPGHERAQR